MVTTRLSSVAVLAGLLPRHPRLDMCAVDWRRISQNRVDTRIWTKTRQSSTTPRQRTRLDMITPAIFFEMEIASALVSRLSMCQHGLLMPRTVVLALKEEEKEEEESLALLGSWATRVKGEP